MNRITRPSFWILLSSLGATLAAAIPAASASETATARPVSAKVKRGQYLVDTSACHDCHTPLKMGPNGPERDMTRMLSGHPAAMVLPPAPKLPPGPWIATMAATMTAWSGPWGTSFVANITPHKQTGIGQWTERNFIEAIRTGRHMGRGRPILPPMPWDVFRKMNDADLSAIFAYLQSVPALDNKVPEPILAAPPPEVVGQK